jgi:hypothetical protein
MMSFVALGAALGAAGLASAQVALTPVAGPSDPTTTTWSGGYNLGPVVAGSYNSYLIITDWGGSTNFSWSSEARASLHGSALGPLPGTGTGGPSGSGTIFAATSGAASNSFSSTAAVNNIFWLGNLGTNFESDGTSDLFLSHRSTFGTTGGAQWSNMRVVLNPRVTTVSEPTLFGLSTPAAFTDLGQLSVGSTNQTIAVNNTATGPAGTSWFRFTVNADVNSSNAFDIFASDGPNATNFDTRLSIFRMTDSGLAPVASTDDMNGATNRQGGVTFGSEDTEAFGRDEYAPATAANFFNGRGGTLALPGMASVGGYFASTPGAATLTAGTEYFVALSFWSGTLPGAIAGAANFLDADELGVTSYTDAVRITLGSSGTALGEGNVLLNIRSIPAPGAIALLGLAGLVGSRRRRD